MPEPYNYNITPEQPQGGGLIDQISKFAGLEALNRANALAPLQMEHQRLQNTNAGLQNQIAGQNIENNTTRNEKDQLEFQNYKDAGLKMVELSNNPNATREDYAKVAAVVYDPNQRAALNSQWAAMPKPKQEQALKDATGLSMLFASGKSDQALQIMEEKKAAYENAGDKGNADFMNSQIESARYAGSRAYTIPLMAAAAIEGDPNVDKAVDHMIKIRNQNILEEQHTASIAAIQQKTGGTPPAIQKGIDQADEAAKADRAMAAKAAEVVRLFGEHEPQSGIAGSIETGIRNALGKPNPARIAANALRLDVINENTGVGKGKLTQFHEKNIGAAMPDAQANAETIVNWANGIAKRSTLKSTALEDKSTWLATNNTTGNAKVPTQLGDLIYPPGSSLNDRYKDLEQLNGLSQDKKRKLIGRPVPVEQSEVAPQDSQEAAIPEHASWLNLYKGPFKK